MLEGDGEKPDWAREYGSGNSGEEGGWMPVRWRERVRQAAARAEEEERQARRDLDGLAAWDHNPLYGGYVAEALRVAAGRAHPDVVEAVRRAQAAVEEGRPMDVL